MRQLLVNIRYTVRPGVVNHLQPWLRLGCSHVDILEYLDRVRAGRRTYDCGICRTTIEVDSHYSKSVIQVARDFGGEPVYSWNRTWRNQCELQYRFLHK